MRLWAAITLFAALLTCARTLYDPARLIESARIYGNIDSLAYYYVDLLVGTPPQRVSVIVDTGTGVCAFSCASCLHCGNHIDPAFHFGRSSTARWQPCDHSCAGSRCSEGRCSYHQAYSEGSSITGYWFLDKVRLGDALQRNPVVEASMGCHQDENNLFYTQRANGVMGIAPATGGRATVLQELFRDRDHVDSSVFAMCLAEWGGRLVVGGYNETYHIGPIQWLTLSANSGYYSVPLTEMRLNDQHVYGNFGRTIVDSGTTYTYMKSAAYRALRRGIENYCRSQNCGANHQGSCWTMRVGFEPTLFPDVHVIFEHVRVVWSPRSYLYRTGGENKWCYSFEDDGKSAETVLGASWMIHKEIIFDMPRARMGVVQAQCPEFRERPVHDPDANLDPPTHTAATFMFTTTSTSSTITTSSVASSTTRILTTVTTTTVASSTDPFSVQSALPDDASALSHGFSSDAATTTTTLYTTSTQKAGPSTSTAGFASSEEEAAAGKGEYTGGAATSSPTPPVTEGLSTSNAVEATSSMEPDSRPTSTQKAGPSTSTTSFASSEEEATGGKGEHTSSAATSSPTLPATEGLSQSNDVETTSSMEPDSRPTSTQKSGPSTSTARFASSDEEAIVGKSEDTGSAATSSQTPPATEGLSTSNAVEATSFMEPNSRPTSTQKSGPSTSTASFAPSDEEAIVGKSEGTGSAATSSRTPAVTEGFSTLNAVEATSSMKPDSRPTSTQKARLSTSTASFASSEEEATAGKRERKGSAATSSPASPWPLDPISVAAGAAAVVSLALPFFCMRYLCRWLRSHREHRHVKLKEIDDSGMPPQIVGSMPVGSLDPDTFVTGDDDLDGDDGSGYVDVDVSASLSSAHAATEGVVGGWASV